MKAHIDHHGGVTITFSSQDEWLAAPGGKKYLPCSACMELQAVEMDVASITCDSCVKANFEGRLEECPDCRRLVKPMPWDGRKAQVRSLPPHADEDGTGYETVMVGEVGVKCPCCGAVLHSDFSD